MTDVDELLSRLRNLPPVQVDAELSASVQRRGRRRVTVVERPAAFASFAVFCTVVVYLGWALHFTSALY